MKNTWSHIGAERKHSEPSRKQLSKTGQDQTEIHMLINSTAAQFPAYPALVFSSPL